MISLDLVPSPSGYGLTLEWLDWSPAETDALEAEIVADRLAREYDAEAFGALIGIQATTVRQSVKRGRIPEPERLEHSPGGPKQLWSAAQVAQVVIERGVST